MSPSLQVVAGNGGNREVVGTIPAQEGMLTNEGVIERITPAGTVFLTDGRCFKNAASRLTVRHSEAYAHGYPYATGCTRLKVRQIRRAGEYIRA